jgi:hypothetical protein
MKITIINSCAGTNGEHLEAGITVDYFDDDAKALIRTGRAVIADDDAIVNAGGKNGDNAPTAEVAALLELTKDGLLEIAAKEEVEVKASASKTTIAEAIILKRSAAA